MAAVRPERTISECCTKRARSRVGRSAAPSAGLRKTLGNCWLVGVRRFPRARHGGLGEVQAGTHVEVHPSVRAHVRPERLMSLLEKPADEMACRNRLTAGSSRPALRRRTVPWVVALPFPTPRNRPPAPFAASAHDRPPRRKPPRGIRRTGGSARPPPAPATLPCPSTSRSPPPETQRTRLFPRWRPAAVTAVFLPVLVLRIRRAGRPDS
jgi:hypothetical protein